MRLSRDDILKAEDIESTEIEVPEWGGSVMVRGLTGRQRDEFEAQLVERRGNRMVPNMANVRAKLVSQCIVDDAGRPIFNPGDVQALGEKSAAAIDRIYAVAARMSGLTEADVEDLTENFQPTPSAAQSSNSHSTSARRSASS